ncbi:MAG: hypothetical protein NTZ16_12750, partial [Verrucomicrobia bacterium]|nr:hypothetical protein [Verrucomicrobiota bacterium]
RLRSRRLQKTVFRPARVRGCPAKPFSAPPVGAAAPKIPFPTLPPARAIQKSDFRASRASSHLKKPIFTPPAHAAAPKSCFLPLPDARAGQKTVFWPALNRFPVENQQDAAKTKQQTKTPTPILRLWPQIQSLTPSRNCSLPPKMPPMARMTTALR